MDSGQVASTAVLIFLLFSCISSCQAREPRRDPELGVVRLMYIGAPFMGGPFPYLKADPLIDATPVDGNAYGIPAGLVRKALRIYLPRSYESLESSYDILGIDDATCANIDSRVLGWFRDGVMEDGLGLFMAGGFESFGGMAGFPSWGPTPVGQVLPLDPTGGYPNGVRIKIIDPDDPLLQSLPFETFGDEYNFFDANTAQEKEGARVIARIVGKNYPAWAWWDIGEGRTYASCTPFRGGGVGPFSQWLYYGDFVSNMVYFTTGIGLPQDIELVHIAREKMLRVIDERSYVISILDFVERFGASSGRALEKIGEAEEQRSSAIDLFRELKMTDSISELDGVLSTLDQAYEMAMEARDRAMMWIFLVQWLVVTGTGLLCGFILWSVMIKRRLYREVATTRLG
jgi:hypothetical protein